MMVRNMSMVIYQHIDRIKGNKNNADKEFKKSKKRDKIKDNYCDYNNIPLLRIPYWQRQNLDLIIPILIQGNNLINRGVEYEKIQKEIIRAVESIR